MPGSFESETSSPSSLISSLRSFRFKNRSKPYTPPAGSASESNTNGCTTRSKQSNSPKISSTQSYNPLGYRQYKVGNISLVPSIISKIQIVLTKSDGVKQLEVTLTLEELKKLKELTLESPKVSENWSNHISEVWGDSIREKILKGSRAYLRQLLNLLSLVKIADASLADAAVVKQPIRTYSRLLPITPVKDQPTADALTTPAEDLHLLNPPRPRNIMDEFAVFSEKEMNLKKLLDLFPEADIMEAQDILVRCNWNFKKALEIAKKHPLRSLKKHPAAGSAPQLPNSGALEEIVLDSSDEESSINMRPPAPVAKGPPPPKRIRRIASSDEDEDDPSFKPSASLQKQLSSIPKPDSTQNNNDKVENSKNGFQLPSSLSIKPSLAVKPMPSPIAKEKAEPPIVRNLPKGLMLVKVRDDYDPLPQSQQSNGTKAAMATKTAVTSSSSTPKPAQVVRIVSNNNAISKNSGVKTFPLPSSKTLSVTPLNKAMSITPVAGSSTAKQRSPKAKKRKKFSLAEDEDEDYGQEGIVYDSDESEGEVVLTSAHKAVLRFLQEATVEELGIIPGCSKRRVEALMKARPFLDWKELVQKLSSDKFLSTDVLNAAKKVLDMRSAINKLMSKCQKISAEMEDVVESLKENKEKSKGYIAQPPYLLNASMHLTPYQMLGLNWLYMMHKQEVNGILADEMGLGKTIQAIAFLAYLKEISTESGPHLIVAPSSVLENWKVEFQTWWPAVSMLCYHGSQDSRRELRMQVLNDEVDEFDIMITTYNMVTSSPEDRGFFKRLEFEYVVFDEAHMLKNMASQRYQHLMKIKAFRRVLLTGTPLQNNLVELMSLLIFAMPNMFSGKTEHIKQMFSAVSKTETNKTRYEKERIEHAKRIMKPFVLRRLKKDVLQDLPKKSDHIRRCPMTEEQAKKYADLVEALSAEVRRNEEKDTMNSSGSGMMMQLRRAANHPMLLRRFYDDAKLELISKEIIKEPTHTQSDPKLVVEDMSVMSDFELHKLCQQYKSIQSFASSEQDVLNSGKFKVLQELLPNLIKEGHRILLFSQFTMVLDIVQEYMDIKKYKFLRLDGQVPVSERQQLINDFNSDPSIFVFLLSTRAGGLGINLTAADTVILHDIDFNPYNDKQAEDRCHRVGQTRDVTVLRLISEGTIEEGILQRATDKLKLERDIHEVNENEENDVISVVKLLKDALGLKNKKS